MKRIYLLLTILLAYGVQSYAQRSIDLTVYEEIGTSQGSKHVIATGEKLLANADGTSKYWFTWHIINKGIDSLKPSDTMRIRAAFGTTYRYGFPSGQPGLGGVRDTIGIIPVSGSSETSVALTPGSAITQSGTKTEQWCDSVWANDVSGTILQDAMPSDDKVCTSVEITFWLLGINSVTKQEDGFILYPNPATNNLNVKFDFGANASANVVIRDVTGRAVYTRDLGKNISGEQQFSLDISSLTPGLYTAELNYNDQKITSKLNIR